MLFPDYKETKRVYHIASITDLEGILNKGIAFDDKATYETKYYAFHNLINQHRNETIPAWVDRSKAIFASMNYRSRPKFHSHTVVLSVAIKPERCWVANENKANQLYEPFIMSRAEPFKAAQHYLKDRGSKLLEKYWRTSLSFEENLLQRRDLKRGYDAEVLIFHPIPPEDIEILYIVSDHRRLKPHEWKEIFCRQPYNMV